MRSVVAGRDEVGPDAHTRARPKTRGVAPGLDSARAQYVVGAMGLLDDAIREHLELKRLRGADPGRVARAERDALGSARGGEAYAPEEQEHAAQPEAWRDAAGASAPDLTHEEGSSMLEHPGQETVEINMEAELQRGFEDVLEQAPDSWRDAPERERPCFEQRPPRDLDFDG